MASGGEGQGGPGPRPPEGRKVTEPSHHQFERLSKAYDATRSPMDPDLLASISNELSRAGVLRLLEVGVGTGRIARPLMDRGFTVLGLDASPGMLRQASAKGLQRLVRADADHLPLKGGSVDAAFFVHVLHLLDHPDRAIEEARRVGRTGAWAYVRLATEASSGVQGQQPVWDRIYAKLERRGYHGVREGGPFRPQREQLVLRGCPPDHLDALRM